MKTAVAFIAIAAFTFLANMSTAGTMPVGVKGNFSWDGARGIGPQPNGYVWECRDIQDCQYE